MKGGKTTCSVTKTIILLSDEWMMRVMHELLRNGLLRFCELERALPGISTRTLTLKLKKLEEEGLLFKNGDGYYETTEKGNGLSMIEAAMKKYGDKFL